MAEHSARIRPRSASLRDVCVRFGPTPATVAQLGSHRADLGRSSALGAPRPASFGQLVDGFSSSFGARRDWRAARGSLSGSLILSATTALYEAAGITTFRPIPVLPVLVLPALLVPLVLSLLVLLVRLLPHRLLLVVVPVRSPRVRPSAWTHLDTSQNSFRRRLGGSPDLHVRASGRRWPKLPTVKLEVGHGNSGSMRGRSRRTRISQVRPKSTPRARVRVDPWPEMGSRLRQNLPEAAESRQT